MAAAEGAKIFWSISQKYHSMPSEERQIWYLDTVVKPMAANIKDHFAKMLLDKFINRIESDRSSIRPTLGSG